MSSEPRAGSASLSVQQAYDLMMREQIGPALRELGFIGTARIFRYWSDGRKCEIRWQKDSRQTKRQLLRFTMNLGWWWGGGRIFELMPTPATDPWWVLRGGEATQAVADSVVSAIRCYVVPAMLAGLHDLVHQQAPDPRWPRRFPAVPEIQQREPDGGHADGDAWYLQPAGNEADDSFAELGSDIATQRLDAAYHVTETALADPRTVPALIDRLARDPSPYIRKEVASRMLSLVARQPLVRSALEASAAEDEDEMVRGAAFYALRLDLDRDPGRGALARWPLKGGIRGATG